VIDALLDDLRHWLRIPSISTNGGDQPALRAAAEWAAQRVTEAGGTCELQEGDGPPLVVGELRAAREHAPTVLIYGHYDVQDPEPLALWTTPPFEPAVRDGRLYARGSSDDKGNFLPLLHVACARHRAGTLPVHVRVLLEGEEETGSSRVNEWVLADERGADCALLFDSWMQNERTPAIDLATRGMVAADLVVRAAPSDMHSGLYGGAALNAVHALHRALSAVLPGPDGRLPEPLRAGIAEPSPEELASWESLPPGEEALAEVGGRPADATAAAEFWLRTTAVSSLDVNAISAGAPRTIVPALASAHVSVRVAPGQSAVAIRDALEGLLRDALPAGAELDFKADCAEPSLFEAGLPAVKAAQRALERACGVPPALVRSGGTLPILAAFAERGIPAILSGFGLPDDAIHAPDESFRLESLELGLRAAEALYEEMATLR
jgi:acetylornithine deacetylase/succinyl-diaminopimelate desuccinylase-like protein